MSTETRNEEIGRAFPVEVSASRKYRVIASRNGTEMEVGIVFHQQRWNGDGWIYAPRYQAGRSRKLHPTPDAAVKGRLSKYRLEACT